MRGVRQICRPLLVGDPAAIALHAEACGLTAELDVVREVAQASWPEAPSMCWRRRRGDDVALAFGADRCRLWPRVAGGGAARDRRPRWRSEVDAVVAAPQTEKSIALAGIAFDGYPGFVARETGIDRARRLPDAVLRRLPRGEHDAALQRRGRAGDGDARAGRPRDPRDRRSRCAGSGIAAPRILVGGLNPHAGEDGLFGREEIEIIAPAIADGAEPRHRRGRAVRRRHHVPRRDCDAHIVMLHDQGHIPAKLIGFDRTAALPIGSPILFASVAHGSAHDIAGKGVADPGALISAIARMAKAAAGPA